jgi:SAM-dependent methyltransferase
VAAVVLCFMPDPVAALTEVARVVRPGGSVVVGELGRWSPWALQHRVEARRHGGLWNSARFWSKRTLSAALIAAGLVPRDVRAAVFYPKMRIAARLMSRFDASFGAFTTVGAAFIAIAVAFVRPCNHSHYALRCPRGRAMAGRRANGISHPIRPVRHGDGHARTGPAPIL